AVRYTQPGGAVTARLLPEGQWIEVELEDNGPGIPDAERTRVFDRFYRAPGSSGEGSGLGLAIAWEICRSHAATIEIQSAEGLAGTLVRVRMPRTGAPPPVMASDPLLVASA